MTARFQRRLGVNLLLLVACADVPAGATEAPATTDPGMSTAMETGTQTSADPPPASTDTTTTSGDSTGPGIASEAGASEGSASEGSASEGSASEGSASEGSASGGSASEGGSSEGESCDAGDGPAFSVTNNGLGNYTVDGVGDPPLTVVRGCSYTFAIDAPGHPFWIKTVQSTGVGNAYDDGVTGNGTDDGVVTWDVSAAAPDSLFYNCEIHGMMTGTITVIDP